MSVLLNRLLQPLEMPVGNAYIEVDTVSSPLVDEAEHLSLYSIGTPIGKPADLIIAVLMSGSSPVSYNFLINVLYLMIIKENKR